ncbi:LysR family transcriptional regulator [Rhodopseudomonas palustris]|uniref:LysR family transcriptional regulator n=1 Tax=Rhodopseudomonas palustris TaxID=1076 RepID=A0A323UNB4_RHOPL|nr:LysR family transcriptional regulator [Rhodopseudomonas palustris]PZA13879.1 LysR family transcriptional regulator [Rhodopseudomonas palustris]
MIHPSEFGALRGFIAVAQQRSFTAAAATLGVSPSALSQLVRGLEERIGARLLNRTTRSVSLTEAGSLLFAEVEPAISTLSSAIDHARGTGNRLIGTVRLHCFHAAAEMFIAPILPAFTRAHPGIVIDVTVDDTVVDLVANGYDAGIRIGEVVERDMVAVQLGGDIRQIAVASPSYLEQYGTPKTPADLLAHRCIRWRWPGQTTPYAWEFFENGKWFSVAVDGPLIASSRSFTLDAALSGIGIAFLKESTVKDAVADGRLVALLERWSAPFTGFYLCYPQQRQMAPTLRALVDAIAQPFRSG